MSQQAVNLIRAILQGFTGAGLFRRVDYPGAPKREFVDSRSLEEIKASDEIVLQRRQLPGDPGEHGRP